jgi:hypothetical protein
LTATIVGDQLVIGGEGREAIEILAGGSGDTSAMRADIEQRAAATLDGLAHGDASKLLENLHPSVPAADMRDGELAWWKRMTDSLGRVESIELVGSALLSPQSVRTFHRIRFEKGSVLGMYGWSAGRIIGGDADMTLAMATPFLSEGENRIASFDLFTGRTIRATFAIGTNGKPSTLTIHTPKGDVSARRMNNG